MMLISRDGNAEASTSRSRSQRRDKQLSLDEDVSHLTDGGAVFLGSSLQPARITDNHSIPYRQYPSFLSHTKTPISSTDHANILGRYPILSPSSRSAPAIPPQLHSMVSGAGAGLVASIVTCPLDVLKTSLQASVHASGSAEYEGVQKTAGRIWRQAGVRGFYRGLGPTLAGYLPTWGIYFTVYDLIKDRLGVWADNPSHLHIDKSVQHIIAAMTAGATGTVCTNPIWVVKTRFMAQATMAASENRYRSTLEAIATIYRTEGFKTFYKGLLPSLFGVVHVAVQFPLYEAAKSYADTRSAGDSGDHASLPASTILVCSAASKMVASVATYPHEVLRTRLQIHKTHDKQPASSTPIGPSVPGKPSHPHFYLPLVTGSHPPLPLAAPEPQLRLPPPGSSTAAATSNQLVRRGWRREGGIIDTFLEIKRQDGWKGFYRGLSINLVRTVPNSAVTMLTYELIMRSLAR